MLDFNVDLIKEDVIFNVIELDYCDMINEDELEFVFVYFDMLVGGVCVKKDELDKVIEKYLKNNWYINWILKMDLVILCIVIFEMIYVIDVLVVVVLNEVIELVKIFSDDCLCKFVNGVLFNVLKELEVGV